MGRAGLLALCGLLLLPTQAGAALRLSVLEIPPTAEAAEMGPAERVNYTQALLDRLHGPFGIYANSRTRITSWEAQRRAGEWLFVGITPAPVETGGRSARYTTYSEAEAWLRAYFESLAGRRVPLAELPPARTYTLRYYSPYRHAESVGRLAGRFAWTARARGLAQRLLLAESQAAYGEPRQAFSFPWEGALEVTAPRELLLAFEEALADISRGAPDGDPGLIFGTDNALTVWFRAQEAARRLPAAGLLAPLGMDSLPLDHPLSELEQQLLANSAGIRRELSELRRAPRWWMPEFRPINAFAPPPPEIWNALEAPMIAAFFRLEARQALLQGDHARALSTLLDQLVALSYVHHFASGPNRAEVARMEWTAARDAFQLYRRMREDPRGPRPQPLARAALARYAPPEARADTADLPASLASAACLARSVALLIEMDAALDDFQFHYGFYPAHPSELVGAQLRALPLDPCTRRPFFYQRVLGGYRLIGPGPDGALDGRPAAEPWSLHRWSGDLVLSRIGEST